MRRKNFEVEAEVKPPEESGPERGSRTTIEAEAGVNPSALRRRKKTAWSSRQDPTSG